jgi:DNA-directed RNA polymerase delta subunit
VKQFKDELSNEISRLNLPEQKKSLFSLQQKTFQLAVVLNECVKLQIPKADETTQSR